MQQSSDLQRRMPLERWDDEQLRSVGPEADKIYANFAATLDSPVADFDTACFGLSKAEASAMDAQVRKQAGCSEDVSPSSLCAVEHLG